MHFHGFSLCKLVKNASILFFTLFQLSIAGPGGDAGFPVLKQPLSAWQSGLGEQLILGRDATWTNPALAARQENVTMILNYEKWFTDVTASHLGAHFPIGDWVVSTQFYLTQVSGLEVRTAATEVPVTDTDAHYLFAKVGIGYQLSDQISLGLSGKYIGEKIFTSTSQGMALDFAAYYKFNEIPAEVSILLANLGSTDNLLNESTPLPLLFGIAGSYGILQDYESVNVNLIYEAKTSQSSEFKNTFGAEIGLWDVMYVQLGYMLNEEIKSFTAGTQVSWKGFRIGFAWVPVTSDFGDRTSFSLVVDF